MNHLRAAGVAVPLGGIVLAAAAGAWSLTPGPAPLPAARPDSIEPAGYRTFGGCQPLLDYLRSSARPLVGPYGLQGGAAGGRAVRLPTGGSAGWAGGDGVTSEAVRAAASGAAASAPLPAAAAPAAPASGTGTNVQVAGVDEADVSKRAGDLFLTVAGRVQGLTVLRPAGRTASVAGRLDLGWRPSELVVDGKTVLLLGPTPEPAAQAPSGTPIPRRTRIAEVNVDDPVRPRLVRTLDIDGSSVGARLADGVLRLAVSAAPDRLPFVVPRLQGPLDGAKIAKAEAAALTHNRGVVAASRIDQWLPRYTVTASGGAATSGSLLSCDDVGVPDRFSGLGTVALLTFDLHTGGVSRWRSGGVVAGGATLYSTGDHTYAATSAWRSPVPVVPPRTTDGRPSSSPAMIAAPPAGTQIHAFSTTARGVHYLGSGQVDGRLLDQYALDEYQGRLRVATTTEPAWGGEQPFAASAVPAVPAVQSPEPAGTRDEGGAVSSTPRHSPTRRASSNAISVLQLRGGRLVRVGYVGGLGAGELIRGVRFAGPLDYVVTFRRTDPLYTLDLSNPTHPTVAGDLTLLGYSAYLHPIDAGRLLGVGQDATGEGAVQGVQLSLFDVVDPSHPRLLDRVRLPGSWAGTEADPHAFTYAGGLALVPVGTGVLAVRVDRNRLGTPAVLQLDGDGSPELDASAVRTFVDSSTLWTIAPGPGRAVLAVHDAATLTRLSAVSF